MADVELSLDRVHQGNSVHRELLGEQLGRLLLKRVRFVLGLVRAVGRNLGTPGDHHEEFARASQGNRRPRGHSDASQGPTDDDVRH
jgi:hypothetical protein